MTQALLKQYLTQTKATFGNIMDLQPLLNREGFIQHKNKINELAKLK